VAQRFLRSDPADLGAIRDTLKDIVEDNSRAGEVIHRLRTLIRKDPQELAPVHLGTVVQDVFALVRSDALLRGNRVVLDVDAGLPAVLGDRVQLQQVLLNGFDAMKDVPADRRLTRVRAGREGGGTVKVAVVDRGAGLSGQMLEQIFQPFFTTKRGGLGMGLSISRSIIHAHAGRLWAENNVEGGGAAFYFTLPVGGG
jgi:two-component system sensor kinase FixL